MVGRSSQRQVPRSNDVQDLRIALQVMTPTAELSATMGEVSRRDMDRPDLRAWCIGNVIMSIVLATTSIVLGVLIFTKQQSTPGFLRGKCANVEVLNLRFQTRLRNYVPDHYAFPSTASGSWIFLLGVQLVLTLVLDAHDRIHATAMIWLLQAESYDKPEYNTNGQLLSGTRRFGRLDLS